MQEHSITERLIGGLSYLSILFLPVLFPLVTWIIGRDTPYVRTHARQAFWTQLFPFLFMLIIGLVYFGLGAAGAYHIHFQAGWVVATLMTLIFLVSMALYIYNIAMAVLVFLDRR